jgi:glycolate oxidase FAD binding subunit
MSVSDGDIGEWLRQRVLEAAARGQTLCLRGGDTKGFHGRTPAGEPLELAGHRGIVSYEPTELVITARGGTPLSEIESVLAEHGQMLPCDPPHFAPGGTLGGVVAAGLGGPRRPWGGAPRDLLLGVRLLDGRGRILRFGGQVMKNVAGYDISRLMAGALGTLGVLLEVSLKVLPRPALERTLRFELAAGEALRRFRELAQQPLPITGAAHLHGQLYLRLAGSEAVLAGHRARIGGEFSDAGDSFWSKLRDHRLDFFADPQPLWRLSLPPATRHPVIDAPCLIDWAGAQRWVKTDWACERVQAAAAKTGGHAVLFRHGDRNQCVFQPLAPPLEAIHRCLKQVFDPSGIFNPGRLYPGW